MPVPLDRLSQPGAGDRDPATRGARGRRATDRLDDRVHRRGPGAQPRQGARHGRGDRLAVGALRAGRRRPGRSAGGPHAGNDREDGGRSGQHRAGATGFDMTENAGLVPFRQAAWDVLAGVDRAAFAVAFAGRLREAGLPVGLTAVEDFARALGVTPPASLSQLYWAARISLVRRRSELEAFEAVFAAVFDDLDPLSRSDVQRGGLPGDRYARLPNTDVSQLDGDGLPWTTLP